MRKYLVLCGRLCRVFRRECGKSMRMRVGMFLLAVNVPFGYGAMAVCSWLCVKTGRRAFWGMTGGLCYALSWAMLLAGSYLAGREAKDACWRRMKMAFRAWRRFYRRKGQ